MPSPFSVAEQEGLIRSFRNAGLMATPLEMDQLLTQDVPQGPLTLRVNMLRFEVKRSLGSPQAGEKYEFYYTACIRSLKGPVQSVQYIEHKPGAPDGMPADGTLLKEWYNPLVPMSEMCP